MRTHIICKQVDFSCLGIRQVKPHSLRLHVINAISNDSTTWCKVKPLNHLNRN